MYWHYIWKKLIIFWLLMQKNKFYSVEIVWLPILKHTYISNEVNELLKLLVLTNNKYLNCRLISDSWLMGCNGWLGVIGGSMHNSGGWRWLKFGCADTVGSACFQGWYTMLHMCLSVCVIVSCKLDFRLLGFLRYDNGHAKHTEDKEEWNRGNR